MLELVVSAPQNLKDFTDNNYAQASFCLRTLLKDKEVKVNGKKVGENLWLNVGDVVRYYLTAKQAQKPAFHVVYQDENIVVIDKENGVNSEAVFADLSRRHGEGGRFIHRLDRNTQGLMVFALNEETEKALLDAFKTRAVGKVYHALCIGALELPQATLTAYLKKDETKSLVKVFDQKVAGAEEIITEYKVLDYADGLSKAEIILHTGKTHQIRAHFAHIGNPVLGDMKYGNEEQNKLHGVARQALVSKRLCLHLTGAWSYLNEKVFISQFEV